MIGNVFKLIQAKTLTKKRTKSQIPSAYDDATGADD